MIFNKRNIYNVYVNPDAKEPLQDLKFIPDSFHIGAIIFGSLWMLFHRLWIVFAFFLSTMLLLNFGANEGILSLLQVAILRLALLIYIGSEASSFREFHLKNKGYIPYGITSGTSEEDAEIRFLDGNLEKLQKDIIYFRNLEKEDFKEEIDTRLA